MGSKPARRDPSAAGFGQNGTIPVALKRSNGMGLNSFLNF
jgi:hypothetical protein